MRGRRSGEMLGRVAAALPSRTSEEIFLFVSKAVWISWVGSIPPAAESLLLSRPDRQGRGVTFIIRIHPGRFCLPFFYSLPPRSKTGVFLRPSMDMPQLKLK